MEMEYYYCSGSAGGGSTPEADFSMAVNDDRQHHDVANAMYLVWEDLTVMLPNFGNGRHTRRLLDGLNGRGRPLRVLLRVTGLSYLVLLLDDPIIGRLSGNVVMTGNVLLNGKRRRLNYGVAAYVTQEDVLLGTLTVRETITYSAYLRLPPTLSKEEVNGIIEATIMEMGLQDCADRNIGNWHLRGISGGEKKRLSIALEILTRPRLFSLRRLEFHVHVEETLPITFFAVIIHMLNPDFNVEFFFWVEQGIEMCSDPLMNRATAEIKAMLVEKYRCSEYSLIARERIREILTIEGLGNERKSGSQAKWWKQLSVLTRRSFVNMSRDVGYYWLRIGVYIALSICVGSIFFDVGTNFGAILARGACGGFLSGFMTFMSIGGFPSFLEEMKVFYKERLNGHYGVAVYILSNFLSSFPFLALMSLSTGTITYYMVKFRPEFSNYLYLSLDLISSIATVESSMMIIASLVPNFLMGVIIGAGYIGIMMMTSGFFRLLPDLPKPIWRYPISYINYGAWGLQGAYKNDMIGLEFDSFAPNGPKLKGEFILKNMLGVQLDHSKWWDLAAVVFILVSFRLLFFAILKFKERASPYYRTFYTKRTLRNLKKRSSFRKTAVSFPSKRHQPLHPLSAQEGFNSPLH
ncbi:hypothetical protein FEM48_Zijuj02G0192100 [Ziziphus jujuba var. spinosa]|uniref:ABC transporter G family member 15-like n=1 Tax=Ziziphus jujuba var. spinosa TaxID=714518 RepID=A0A978VXG9_ZIZJJ|nr:hypothetical protein FEM48_Zijuj02G0192100 [Ziziphus jujuba var. spinosa]